MCCDVVIYINIELDPTCIWCVSPEMSPVSISSFTLSPTALSLLAFDKIKRYTIVEIPLCCSAHYFVVVSLIFVV